MDFDWSLVERDAGRLGIRDRPSGKGRAVVVISGVARMEIPESAGLGVDPGPDLRAKYVDLGLAPQWFKTVTQDTWDDNNFYPHDYSRNPVRGLQLWRQAAAPALPVSIRYLCELWASESGASSDG